MPRPVRDSSLNAQTPPQPMPMNPTWVEGCTAHQASKDIKLQATYVGKRQNKRQPQMLPLKLNSKICSENETRCSNPCFSKIPVCILEILPIVYHTKCFTTVDKAAFGYAGARQHFDRRMAVHPGRSEQLSPQPVVASYHV